MCAHMLPYCSAHEQWLIMKLLQVCQVLRRLGLNCFCVSMFDSGTDYRPGVGIYFRLRRNVRENLAGSRDIHKQDTIEAGRR